MAVPCPRGCHSPDSVRGVARYNSNLDAWHRSGAITGVGRYNLMQGQITMLHGLLLILVLLPVHAAHADISGRVVAVTDGDTIKVLDANNTEYKVRLAGIDAPEKNQPYGAKSREHLAFIVAGKEVFVESDKNDRYGRVLGKVWVQPSDCPACGKTLDANHAQVVAGMAWWYRYFAREQSPEDRGRYESAEDEARQRKWGLWADQNPVNPYDWRRGQR